MPANIYNSKVLYRNLFYSERSVYIFHLYKYFFQIGENMININFFYYIKDFICHISKKWDGMAQNTSSAINFAHDKINLEPSHEQKWFNTLAHNIEHYNRILRSSNSNASKDTIDNINEISNHIRDNMLQNDIILYRQISKTAFENMKKEAQSFSNIDLYDKGFICTTLVKGIENHYGFDYNSQNRYIKLRIYVPAETGCIYMGNINSEDGNYEVILPPGSKFKIISIDRYYINCKII